jgi:FKBP-type peptidyl-prolyl cis-trans isomerase
MIRIGALLVTGMISASAIQAQPLRNDTLPAAGITSSRDSLMYALGSYLAQWVNKNRIEISNAPLFLKGMDDVFRGHPRRINDTLVNKMITDYQAAQKKQQAREEELRLFRSLKQSAGLGILPNGVYYQVIKNGEGAHPRPKDTVTIHFRGMLADGTVFDDTRQKGRPDITPVSDMIPGIAAALPLMGEGTEWKLYIPSSLAYGDKGNTVIPPASALVVELSLIKVTPALQR